MDMLYRVHINMGLYNKHRVSTRLSPFPGIIKCTIFIYIGSYYITLAKSGTNTAALLQLTPRTCFVD